jgi:hypothetical protein
LQSDARFSKILIPQNVKDTTDSPQQTATEEKNLPLSQLVASTASHTTTTMKMILHLHSLIITTLFSIRQAVSHWHLQSICLIMNILINHFNLNTIPFIIHIIITRQRNSLNSEFDVRRYIS